VRGIFIPALTDALEDTEEQRQLCTIKDNIARWIAETKRI
jgi:hypothetical protein